MKDYNLKNIEAWIKLALKSLSSGEFQVFIAWLIDSPDFSACASVLTERTQFDIRSVRRHLSAIEKKGLLIRNGTKKVLTSGGKQPMTCYRLPSLSSEISQSKKSTESPKANMSQKKNSENVQPASNIKNVDVINLDLASGQLIDALAMNTSFNQAANLWMDFFRFGGTESFLGTKIYETYSNAVQWKRSRAYKEMKRQIKEAENNYKWNHAELKTGEILPYRSDAASHVKSICRKKILFYWRPNRTVVVSELQESIGFRIVFLASDSSLKQFDQDLGHAVYLRLLKELSDELTSSLGLEFPIGVAVFDPNAVIECDEPDYDNYIEEEAS